MRSLISIGVAALFLWVSPDHGLADTFMTTGNVPSEMGIRKVPVVEGLEHPWAMTWLPEGDILITERPGRLRVVRKGRLLPDPVGGIPDVFAKGQGGLLDLALHPSFDSNRTIYFTCAQGSSGSNRTTVARALFDGNRLSRWEIVFEASPPKPGTQHFGSRLLWLPDGTLLVSVGDGGNPPVRLDGQLIRESAQRLDRHLGKILRLNDDGTIPSDNPFVDLDTADGGVWSYGHRNVQGLAFDSVRHRVWATEHGALGGDELNAVDAGKNYGWPAVTFSREYVGGGRISAHTSLPGKEDPALVWMNAIAPSGLALYDGDRYRGWRGQLFAGGLVSQDVRRLALDAEGRVVTQSAIRIGERVRDVRQGPDGFLYVLTDESNGQLIRLEPAPGNEGDAPP
ncbi:MAG: PQQ-dependent sugar dehydrogenase [Desulfobacterales bacterium]|jgi:glucose/arabinose dehydrogenase